MANAALNAGAKVLAVATPEEALHIREAGITAELLVLGAAPASFFSKASELNITLTAYSLEWLLSLLGQHDVGHAIVASKVPFATSFAQEQDAANLIAFPSTAGYSANGIPAGVSPLFNDFP